MDEKGVFAVARSVWGHDAFAEEPYSEREAWIWLVGSAAWKACRTRAGELDRGEFTFSLRFLMEKWKWKNKDRVHRFMKRLQKRDMIRDTSRNGYLIYSINKYNDFQVVGIPKRDKNRTVDATPVQRECDKEEALETLSKETKEDAAPKGAVVLALLPSWLNAEAWRGYVEMRRKARKPMTPRAQSIILAKLDRWRQLGHDPTAILDNSTANNWTDVYEPKGQRNDRSKPTSHDTFIGAGASLARDYLAADGQGSGDGGPDAVQAGRPLLSP